MQAVFGVKTRRYAAEDEVVEVERPGKGLPKYFARECCRVGSSVMRRGRLWYSHDETRAVNQ